MQHLDYLDSLGVTAIWTTPVLENDMGEGSYHGYAATDYYKIDPRLGTNEDYVRLAELMHQRGLKLIMDMVLIIVEPIILGCSIHRCTIGLIIRINMLRPIIIKLYF